MLSHPRIEQAVTYQDFKQLVEESFAGAGVDLYHERQAILRRVNDVFMEKDVSSLKFEANRRGSPTNQRGRLTVEGLSPEEAIARLQALGVVGALEEQVPFESLMRSKRREGLVMPLHRDYITGDAPLPRIHHLLTHGLTGGFDEHKLRSILKGGGLHSIAERFRRGIKASTASPAGDIRSGIDHVVFIAHDSGSTVGSGAAVRVALKPEAMLRRNVVMAPRDFGGMDTRYQSYKDYLNGLQRRAKEPETNLYSPVSPKVRQYHLNAKKNTPGSAEFNISGSIPIEDMAFIGVSSQNMDTVNKILDEALAEGIITSKPEVVDQSTFHQRTNNLA
jgi:hypothetical protein